MATPYSQLPYGFRRGEENYAYGEYLRKQRELKRATDFADRIAAEEERISLERWQPEPEQQEVKITTKADGTSTIVSTEKYPGVPESEIAQEQLRQGGYGLTYPDEQTGILGTPYEGIGDLTWEDVDPTLFQLDQDPGINPPRQGLYPDARAGDRFDPERRGVGVWPFGTGWTATGVGQDFSQVPDAGMATLAAREAVNIAPQDDIYGLPNVVSDRERQARSALTIGSQRVVSPEEEVVVSPEGTPIPGVDMGGLQRFEPNIIPDEAYRQAYGEQARVMGLLEPDVPPPDLQVMEPQPQTAFINRAIEEVDRGTANILPPSHLTMGDMPPTLPNWFTGMGEAEAPFAPPQAIAPEQGPLGPPGQYSVGPPAITQGEREAELAAALGEGGARYSEALPMDSRGLLTDEEILAGAQMPYGDPGVTPMERALMESTEGGPVVEATPDIFAGIEPEAPPLTSEDIFGGVSPEVPLDPVDPGLRPRGRVETDIEESVLETAPKKWLDPDTGLIPIERGMLRDVPPLMEETPTQRRERLAAPVEEASIWGGDPALSGVRTLRASYQEEQDELVDESTKRYEALMGRAEKAIEKAEETTEQTKKVIDFQRLDWFAKLNQQLTEKRRRQGSQVRVGRARSRQQIPMLNPTPLRSA